MTATAHVLVGAAIAATIKNPYLGLTIAAASHPLLDIIPHWDAASGWRKKTKARFFAEASLDLLIGIIVSFFLFGSASTFWYFALCVFAAIAWDFMEVPFWFWNWRFPPFSWSHYVQSRLQGKARFPWGILTQVAVVGTIVLVAKLFL